MTDIATLGFKIDSKPVADAAVNLDKMDAAGKRAQSGVEKILAAINKQTAELQKLNGAMGGNATNAERMAQSQTRAADAIRKTNDQASRTGGIFGNAANAVKGFVAAFVSIQGARSLIRLADEAAGLNARLRLATDSQRAFNAAQAETFAIAQRTSTALSSTVQLYARIQQSTEGLGVAQERLLAITETINQTFIVSGTSSANASNAIIQLTQAFAGGVLRAEEFNSIIENSPRLAQAFADGLGVSTGALRKMVNDGEVDVTRMIAALESQSAAIQAEFETMPVTIGQAWQQVQNAVLAYVGEADQAAGASRQIAEAIQWVAENFEKVAPVVGAAVAAMAAWIALTSPLGLFVTAAAALAAVMIDLADNSDLASASTRAYVDAVNQAAAANQANTLASVAALAGIHAETAARLDLAKAALAEANAKAIISGLFWTEADLAAAREAQANVDTLSKAVDDLAAKGGAAIAGGLGQFVRGVAGIEPAAAAATRGAETAAEAAKRLADAKREAAAAEREIQQATTAAGNAYMGYIAQLNPVLSLELEHAAALEQIEHWHALGAISVERYGHMKAQAAQVNAIAIAEMKREADVLGRLNDDHAEQIKMLGMTRRELAGYQAAVRAVASATDNLGNRLPGVVDSLEDIATAASDSAKEIFDIVDQMDAVDEILQEFGTDAFDSLTDKIGTLRDEIDRLSDPMSDAFDPDRVDAMERAIERMNVQLKIDTIGNYKALLGAAQSFTKEGSKGFKAMEVGMAALSIVQDVIALKAGVSAVLTQGQGDPYSAWARMAAMAGAVAPYLASIGVTLASFGGGGGGGASAPSSQSASVRQASQGTGSVLGDAEAKSESILNALEITADATSQLVGLNRGMLNALLNLQQALGDAGGQLARGAGTTDFTRQAGDAGNWNWLFGGDSELIDEGIIIAGGRLQDMLNDIVIGAYQTIETDGGWFHSDDTDDEVVDVSSQFGRQFQLVIESIMDAVREGALALGVLPAEIEAAIAAFQVEEIRISLMDLSPEEQAAEMEAVFGQIFDGLAGSVVPWIEQFQQVGEGLGETLVRVATGVQVMQEAIAQLGFRMEGKPEQFAQFSEALIEMMGGIEGMIEGMSAFMAAFATDEHRFAVASEALASAFEQVGLTVPATRDGMWELMQSLDGTTEQGQEQIATLLRLAGVADQYYGMLERGGAAMVDQMTKLSDILGIVDQALREASGGSAIDWQQEMVNMEAANRRLIATAIEQGASEEELARIRRFGRMRLDELAEAEEQARAGYSRMLAELQRDGWSQPIQGLMRLYDEYQQQVEALHAAARAAGRTGASTWALAAAQAAYERQVRRFAAQLLQSAQSLLGQLGYAGYAEGGSEADLRGVNDVTQAVEDRYATELALLEQLDAFVRGLGISALSPLTPRQQLQESEAEYMRLLALAQAGDMDALAQLQAAASNYLGQAQSYYGGVGPYQEIFDLVRGQLGGLVEAGPRAEQIGPNTPVYGGPVTVEPGEAWGQMNALERTLLAQQLVDHLAALSIALNTPILQLLEDLNIPLTQLVTDLGINLEQISGAAVTALAQLAFDLGLPLGELVQALGLELPDLADGVRDLATEMGINLSELTAATAFQLADLARSLNVDLADLTTALGIDLGRLTDVNSPIYQALAQTIGTLPDEQAAALRTYLEAIAQSPDGQSAAANIAAMEDYINTLDADIALALAPFFGGVDPPGALSELDYLGFIDVSLESLLGLVDGENGTNGILTRIETALGAAPTGGGIPGYAAGGMVGGPTLAWVGESGRELVLPNGVTEFFARNGIPINTGGDAAMLYELRAVRRELYDLRQQQAETGRREEQHLSRISDGTDRSARANERAADVMGARS